MKINFKLLLLLILQVYLQQNVKAATDPFIPFLNSVPTVKQVLSEDNTGSGDSAITTRKFILSSRKGINSVYTVMAYPQRQGKYPALLILHGGGGNAQGLIHLVESYAARGYVAICFDMPGICNNSTTPNSGGPWKSRPGPLEVPRFAIADGLENSTLFDAGVAGLEVFNFVASQKNVDTQKIGITGFSWGGYATTFLSGILGNRVKAAYAVFGCGFYEKGSFWTKIIADLPDSVRTPWLKYFDAGRRAPGIKAPYFLEATSNDTYFWPESVENTLDAIPGTKNHVWDTNFNHKQMPSGPKMQQMYFDYYLKGAGESFASAKIVKEQNEANGSKQLTIKLDIPKGVVITSVVVYYSEQAENWQARKWVSLPASASSTNVYTALLPPDLVKKGVNYYAYVTDMRTVAVASDMYNSLYSIQN